MVPSVHRTVEPSRKTAARSIVVGADTRGRSTSAVVWAAEEARRTGAPLRVVTAHDRRRTNEDPERPGLDELARRLTLTDVTFHEAVGDAAEALLASVVDADAQMLVVGRRSSGVTQRALISSTSRAVAGRAQVPVVVVPEPWIQPVPSSGPIVVGVGSPALTPGDLRDRTRDDDALAFAFERAAQLRVTLIAVSAWEMPSIYTWSAADVVGWRRRYEVRLAERLARWCRRYPDVEVVARSVPEPARVALLDASKGAQLTVLGRRPDAHLRGLPLGSIARSVLHGVDGPVAVIPVPPADQPAVAHERVQVSRRRPAWSPMS